MMEKRVQAQIIFKRRTPSIVFRARHHLEKMVIIKRMERPTENGRSENAGRRNNKKHKRRSAVFFEKSDQAVNQLLRNQRHGNIKPDGDRYQNKQKSYHLLLALKKLQNPDCRAAFFHEYCGKNMI